MTRFAPIALTAGLALVGLPMLATAESSDRPDRSMEEGGRYSFHRSGEKFIRLDSRTGAVAQCASGPIGWTCNAVPDERAAFEDEIARLQKENAALKQTLLAKGIDLPPEARPGAVGRNDEALSRREPGASEPRMPTDAEIDRAVAFMKNVWRRLIEMMADLQRDMQKKS